MNPHRRLALELARQVVLVGLAALVYFGVRGLTQGATETALDNAGRVLGAEGVLWIDWEASIQDAIVDHSWIVTLANWVYIYGHWPVVIATLVWLFVRHHADFFVLRNAMFISGAIGIVVFALFPTAPPRLAELGLVDTVTVRSESYRTLQPPALLNKYAAMPSLHFGWNLIVGIVAWRVTRNLAIRIAAIAVPCAMAVAVVATANHFVLDVVAGGLVALVGLWVSDRVTPYPGRPRMAPR